MITLVIRITWRTPFKKALIELDQRLEFDQTLGTAFEFYHHPKQARFRSILIQKATTLLNQLNQKDFFPNHFPLLYPGILILTILTAMIIVLHLFYTEDSVSGFKIGWNSPDKQNQTSVAVAPLEEVEVALPNSLVSLESLFKKDEQDSLSPAEFEQKATSLLKRINADQDRLKRRLQDSFMQKESPDLPSLDLLNQKTFSAKDIERLQKEFNSSKTLSRSSSINSNINDLHKNKEMEEYLVKVLEDEKSSSKPGKKHSGEELNPSEENQISNRKNQKDLAESQSAKNRKPEGTTKQGKASDDSTIVKDHSNLSSRERLQKRKDSDQLFSSKPGKSAPDWESQYPSDLKQSAAPLTQQEGRQGNGEWFKSYVRSLTFTGDVKMKEEAIIRSYQKEMTTVIKNEDIPLNYREFIKRYFLALGVHETGDIKNP